MQISLTKINLVQGKFDTINLPEVSLMSLMQIVRWKHI